MASTVQILAIIFVTILLLNQVEMKPRPRKGKKSGPSFCGKENDTCQPGSRKHCCRSGFTCSLSAGKVYYKKNKKNNRKLIYGICVKLRLPTDVEKEENTATQGKQARL